MIFSSTDDRFAKQDVSARLDYGEDWSEFMALAPTDQIQTSEWVSSDPSIAFSDALIDGSFTTVFVSGGTAGNVALISNFIETVEGRTDVRRFQLSVFDGASLQEVYTTALFNRFEAISNFKTGSLSFLDQSFPIDRIPDETIWENLVAAEADASHRLRVLFQPTKIIPDHAEQSEIDELVAAGTPYLLESAYDFDPAVWQSDAWGYTLLRQTPVISIESVRITYPAPINTILNVPKEWLTLDNKYGHLRFVPAGSMMGFGPMTTFILSAITSGRRIPEALQVRYFAGLSNIARDYPDLLNLVKRMAVLRIFKGGFVPQSSSISSDGLSQSASFDASKWQDDIDGDIDALSQRIKGIRMDVV